MVSLSLIRNACVRQGFHRVIRPILNPTLGKGTPHHRNTRQDSTFIRAFSKTSKLDLGSCTSLCHSRVFGQKSCLLRLLQSSFSPSGHSPINDVPFDPHLRKLLRSCCINHILLSPTLSIWPATERLHQQPLPRCCQL
jgi:hypothetical protein